MCCVLLLAAMALSCLAIDADTAEQFFSNHFSRREAVPVENGGAQCSWARGGKRCCGSLRSPGASHGWREDETDHCFPASASDHMVCCVEIKNVDNEYNTNDRSVAFHNPLSGPIRRNSQPHNYSWCTCSALICEEQLHGRVAWVGKAGDT